MDDARFDDILVAYHAAIRIHIAMKGIRGEAIDDLAQETFLIFHRQGCQPPAGVEPLAWLKGIARNLIAEHFRREGRRGLLMVRLGEALTMAAPEDGDDQPERHRALDDCLARLQPALRDAVLRYYADDADTEALARRHDLTASGLRMLMLRVREQLRRCLARAQPAP